MVWVESRDISVVYKSPQKNDQHFFETEHVFSKDVQQNGLFMHEVAVR